MSTITFSVPEKIELDPRDTVKFLAAKLYEAGRLSLGQAAELAALKQPFPKFWVIMEFH